MAGHTQKKPAFILLFKTRCGQTDRETGRHIELLSQLKTLILIITFDGQNVSGGFEGKGSRQVIELEKKGIRGRIGYKGGSGGS